MSTRAIPVPRTASSSDRPFVRSLARSTSGAMLVNESTGVPVATSVEAAFDSASRKKGLLGRDGLARRHAIVIAPSNAIHTFFMRFPIDVIFAAKDGTIVGLRKSLPAWRMAMALRAYCAIELAAGSIERDSIAIGDRLVVTTAD
jgi:uncharacterized membrane protein (UPF0127 family)